MTADEIAMIERYPFQLAKYITPEMETRIGLLMLKRAMEQQKDPGKMPGKEPPKPKQSFTLRNFEQVKPYLPCTKDDAARALGLTPSGANKKMLAMLRNGLVTRTGTGSKIDPFMWRAK